MKANINQWQLEWDEHYGNSVTIDGVMIGLPEGFRNQPGYTFIRSEKDICTVLGTANAPKEVEVFYLKRLAEGWVWFCDGKIEKAPLLTGPLPERVSLVVVTDRSSLRRHRGSSSVARKPSRSASTRLATPR